MSNLSPQGWRSSWSNPQPAPWLTGLAPPDIAMSELRPQGSSYSGNMGEVSESMAVDRLEVRFDASVRFCAVFDASWPSV